MKKATPNLDVQDINGKYFTLNSNEIQSIELSEKLHYPIKDPRTGKDVPAYPGNPYYVFKTTQETISVVKNSDVDQFVLNTIFHNGPININK